MLREPTSADWRALGTRIAATAVLVVVASVLRLWVLAALVLAAGLPLLVVWHASFVGYRCGRCGAEFTCSVRQDLFGPNGMRRSGPVKYLRCPVCGERSWMVTLVIDRS